MILILSLILYYRQEPMKFVVDKSLANHASSNSYIHTLLIITVQYTVRALLTYKLNMDYQTLSNIVIYNSVERYDIPYNKVSIVKG